MEKKGLDGKEDQKKKTEKDKEQKEEAKEEENTDEKQCHREHLGFRHIFLVYEEHLYNSNRARLSRMVRDFLKLAMSDDTFTHPIPIFSRLTSPHPSSLPGSSVPSSVKESDGETAAASTSVELPTYAYSEPSDKTKYTESSQEALITKPKIILPSSAEIDLTHRPERTFTPNPNVVLPRVGSTPTTPDIPESIPSSASSLARRMRETTSEETKIQKKRQLTVEPPIMHSPAKSRATESHSPVHSYGSPSAQMTPLRKPQYSVERSPEHSPEHSSQYSPQYSRSRDTAQPRSIPESERRYLNVPRDTHRSGVQSHRSRSQHERPREPHPAESFAQEYDTYHLHTSPDSRSMKEKSSSHSSYSSTVRYHDYPLDVQSDSRRIEERSSSSRGQQKYTEERKDYDEYYVESQNVRRVEKHSESDRGLRSHEGERGHSSSLSVPYYPETSPQRSSRQSSLSPRQSLSRGQSQSPSSQIFSSRSRSRSSDANRPSVPYERLSLSPSVEDSTHVRRQSPSSQTVSTRRPLSGADHSTVPYGHLSSSQSLEVPTQATRRSPSSQTVSSRRPLSGAEHSSVFSERQSSSSSLGVSTQVTGRSPIRVSQTTSSSGSLQRPSPSTSPRVQTQVSGSLQRPSPSTSPRVQTQVSGSLQRPSPSTSPRVQTQVSSSEIPPTPHQSSVDEESSQVLPQSASSKKPPPGSGDSLSKIRSAFSSVRDTFRRSFDKK